jgi:hypothetical protein
MFWTSARPPASMIRTPGSPPELRLNGSVTSNTLYGVYMHAEAFTTDSLETETASSSIDPRIGFDPNFADASQFQLLFSEGISPANFSSVPAPIAGAGFPGLIFGERWSSRLVATAAENRLNIFPRNPHTSLRH